MAQTRPSTMLCLASYEKGADFMRECKRLGWRVLLITRPELAEAAWPRDDLDDVFYMRNMYDRAEMINGISYLARTEQIDRITALDDFDVEMGGVLREHFCLPGMGETATRAFRDKLAMRVKAAAAGIPVPAFAHAINTQRLHDFVARVPPPWVLKPRSQASSIGIKMIAEADQLWAALEPLGDAQSHYLLEQYIPGTVHHVDALVMGSNVVFAEAHRYLTPLLDVYHKGGVFGSRTLPRDSADTHALRGLTGSVLNTLGLRRGVTHTEFIKGQDDKLYFLETSARVGGANIADLVHAATGVNLWREWARIECADPAQLYKIMPPRQLYGGILISLARQEHPDTSAYTDPEIVWRMNKKHHVGLVIAASDPQRVEALLAAYQARFAQDFQAVLPAPDKPTA